MNDVLWAAIREYIIAECLLSQMKSRPVRLGPGGGWAKQELHVSLCETEVRRLIAEMQPTETDETRGKS